MNILNFPKRIVLELTSDCNLNCGMCPRKFISDKNGYMDESLWAKLVAEIAECSPDSIILPFWRGESLLHPNFHKFLEVALGKSLRIHLATNGVLLREGDFALLAQCEFITFSIHTITGYSNARRFLSARNDKAPLIQVSFVEGEESMGDIYSKIVNSPSLEGFDSVRVYARHSEDGIFGSSRGTVATKRIFCPKLLDTLVIAYDGTISRCNHIWETEKGINARDKSIREVWNSECLKRIRKDYPDPKCLPCGQWTGHTRGESWKKEDGKIKHNQFNLED